MNSGTTGVTVAKIAKILDLKNYTPDMDMREHKVSSTDVNRPALQLTGYLEHFEESRIELIGNVEYTYLLKMTPEERWRRYDDLLQFDIPCMILCRGLKPTN